MFWFKLRMYLVIGLLFAIVYGIVSVVAAHYGVSNFYFYLGVSIVMMIIQYMIGPKLVEWSMRIRYIKDNEYPQLHRMVDNLARAANIPKPRIGISQIPIPNAFAFGRWKSDGRVCVTEGIMGLLNEDELRAVLGHEVTHLKNRDVLTITLISVIPMILYRIAWSMMFYRSDRRREGSNLALIGILAFVFYFITNLLVLYASRIREYFADKGSVDLGNSAHNLASALYKLVYGSARMPKEALKEVEGLKAFFASDPSRALYELRELKEIDKDHSGSIDASELTNLRQVSIKFNIGDKLLEVFSTHPNMLKRIKRLSSYKNTYGAE